MSHLIVLLISNALACQATPTNTQQKNMKDIRSIYKYNEYMYIRYSKEEKAYIKKKSFSDPNIQILMKP